MKARELMTWAALAVLAWRVLHLARRHGPTTWARPQSARR